MFWFVYRFRGISVFTRMNLIDLRSDLCSSSRPKSNYSLPCPAYSSWNWLWL